MNKEARNQEMREEIERGGRKEKRGRASWCFLFLRDDLLSVFMFVLPLLSLFSFVLFVFCDRYISLSLLLMFFTTKTKSHTTQRALHAQAALPPSLPRKEARAGRNTPFAHAEKNIEEGSPPLPPPTDTSSLNHTREKKTGKDRKKEGLRHTYKVAAAAAAAAAS